MNRTHCKRGHEWVEANIYVTPGGRRECRPCRVVTNARLHPTRTVRRRERVKAMLLEARSGPCVDCGVELPPECMEMDHVRGGKRFELTVRSAKNFGLDTIRAEIEKCDIRCPNCHRLRHYFEQDPSRRDPGGRTA